MMIASRLAVIALSYTSLRVGRGDSLSPAYECVGMSHKLERPGHLFDHVLSSKR